MGATEELHEPNHAGLNRVLARENLNAYIFSLPSACYRRPPCILANNPLTTSLPLPPLPGIPAAVPLPLQFVEAVGYRGQARYVSLLGRSACLRKQRIEMLSQAWRGVISTRFTRQ